jgi:hypothetical protein
MEVSDAEAEWKHKLFPANTWMKDSNFNALASCPKDEFHQ